MDEKINFFAELCSPKAIMNWSTTTKCSRDGMTVSCNTNLLPGTSANIGCGYGYREPNRHIYKDLNCLESGTWDHEVTQFTQELLFFFLLF